MSVVFSIVPTIYSKSPNIFRLSSEQYRDLLRSADTIGEMRKTSSNVTEYIDGIVNSCRNLNENQLMGFKIDSMTSRSNPLPTDSVQINYYGCIAQIQLLTKLPEMIWSRLDESDYFVATQQFFFSRHISTGLQLDANMDISKSAYRLI